MGLQKRYLCLNSLFLLVNSILFSDCSLILLPIHTSCLLQLKEELSVHGSDEEVDEPLEVDSDEDLSDGQKQFQEEVRMCTTDIGR